MVDTMVDTINIGLLSNVIYQYWIDDFVVGAENFKGTMCHYVRTSNWSNNNKQPLVHPHINTVPSMLIGEWLCKTLRSLNPTLLSTLAYSHMIAIDVVMDYEHAPILSSKYQCNVVQKIAPMSSRYRSTIAGSFENNSKNKKHKNYEIMKIEKNSFCNLLVFLSHLRS